MKLGTKWTPRAGAAASLLFGLGLLAAVALPGVDPNVGHAQVQGRRQSGDGVRRVLWVTVRTRSNYGRAFCALWRGRNGYPTQMSLAVGEALDREIENRQGRMYFDNMIPDEYAVACFHDENDNNDLDRTFFGIPLEGTGASNNARGFMGPPPYDSARFRYPRNTTSHHIVVPIVYGW